MMGSKRGQPTLAGVELGSRPQEVRRAARCPWTGARGRAECIVAAPGAAERAVRPVPLRPCQAVTWVPDELDAENDHTREVYAHAGLALYMAQVLEHGLVNVVILSRAGGPEFRTSRDYDRLFDDLIARTMGAQLRRALESVSFAEDQIDRLRKALRLRNFLAHDFFRERIEMFGSVSGRNAMIRELDAMRDAFAEIDGEVQEVAVTLFAKHGVTRDAIEAQVAVMRAVSEKLDWER
jgi:hypothetical protein